MTQLGETDIRPLQENGMRPPTVDQLLAENVKVWHLYEAGKAELTDLRRQLAHAEMAAGVEAKEVNRLNAVIAALNLALSTASEGNAKLLGKLAALKQGQGEPVGEVSKKLRRNYEK